MSDDKPIYMLNALWYKPDGGKETYREYLKAAGPVMLKHGGEKLDSYIPETAIIGDFDADLLFIVKWPSKKVFHEFVNDPEYQAISHLREDAIVNSLLVMCNKIGSNK